MDERTRLGRKGEKLARRCLKRKGYRILARNYVCSAGEVDLIALTGRTIVFVEVKTRSADDHHDPEEAVNTPKQRKIQRVARHWLATHRSSDYAFRFDIVAITLDDRGEPVIRHTEGAFGPHST